MRKKTIRKKVPAAFLSLTMAAVLTACSLPAKTPELNINVKEMDETVQDQAKANVREGTPFSEIPCGEYDDSRLLQMIDETEEKTEDAANSEEVLALFDQILEEQEQLWLAYEMADLYGSINVTDEKYSQLSLELTDMMYNDGDKIDSLGSKILNSPCGTAAEEAWEEEDISYYEAYVELPQELIDLMAEEEELENQYEEYSAQEFTVEVNGKEYDADELYYDQELSYDEYYAAYRELTQKENEVLGPIFVELVKVRQQIAEYSGYDNYNDYAYMEVYNRDYTPHDAQKLAEYVKNDLQDPFYEIYNNYNSSLGTVLDEAFSEMTIPDQMNLTKVWLADVDSSLLTSFLYMEENELYDLEYSENKYDGGYTTWLDVYEEPFLYNQPEGNFYDFMSLVHEFGHFNAYYTNIDTADAQCVDLAEIHSQGLEALYTMFYPKILGEEYGRNATEYTLIQLGGAVLDGCMYDEFQQQVYKLEDPTLDEINRIFCTVAEEYGYDYEGEEEAYEWVEIPHNFNEPLYYISYAVSALPALDIWEISGEDEQAAIDLYMAIVQAGESGTFKETLSACGMENPFREAYTQSIAEAMEAYAKE